MPDTTSQTLEPILRRSELEAEPEVATMAVDILNDKRYRLPFDTPVPKEELSLEERADRGFLSSVQDFNAWLIVKATDALMIQLVDGNLDETSIDMERIAAVLQKEIAAEQTRHAQDAERLREEIIPAAMLRDEPDCAKENLFWQGDIDNLCHREMVHSGMATFIASMSQSGEDWALDLAQGYVEHNKEGARKEAAKSLRAEAEARARKAGQQALLN